MNERIQALMEQATDKWLGGEFFDREKFAELIVRECIELCNKEHTNSIHTHAGAWNTAIKRCKESIELHFGVE